MARAEKAKVSSAGKSVRYIVECALVVYSNKAKKE